MPLPDSKSPSSASSRSSQDDLTSRTVRIVPMVLDMGAVLRDSGKKKCQFKATNVGVQAANLLRLHSSCGCTVVDFKPCELDPGQSVSFAATFDPATRYGPFRLPLYLVVEIGKKVSFLEAAMVGRVDAH
ncbi:MAG: DUF1573 domain-containing protein [Candidatus Sumerlaeota bacterium]|nr:DUF1573 domain-containing protein [Candidatus Sumerlaeota bacterium]